MLTDALNNASRLGPAARGPTLHCPELTPANTCPNCKAAQSARPFQGVVPQQSCVGPRALPGVLIHTLHTVPSEWLVKAGYVLCQSQAGPRSSRPLCHGDVGAGWQSGPLCPRGPISLRRCGVGWDASLLPSDRGGVASLIRPQELQPRCLHSKSQLHHKPACVT